MCVSLCQTGTKGQQIAYGVVPASSTAFAVSAGCHSSGFRVALEGTSNLLADRHEPEDVGWLAIEASVGHIGGKAYEALLTANAVTHQQFDLTFSVPFHTGMPDRLRAAPFDLISSLTVLYVRACSPSFFR